MMCDSTVPMDLKASTHILKDLPTDVVVQRNMKTNSPSKPSVPTTSIPTVPLECKDTCVHDFIEDWIDLDPDRSQRIIYCRICEITKD